MTRDARRRWAPEHPQIAGKGSFGGDVTERRRGRREQIFSLVAGASLDREGPSSPLLQRDLRRFRRFRPVVVDDDNRVRKRAFWSLRVKLQHHRRLERSGRRGKVIRRL